MLYPGSATSQADRSGTISPVTIESPKWPGLAERIADRIRTGELAVGDQLPSQPELARAEGVSLKVVQKALDWLAAVGVVDRRDKVGTFVASVPADPLPPAPVVPSLESRVAALEAWRAEVERQ